MDSTSSCELGDISKKPSSKRQRVSTPSYKHINRIDGPGYYARFVFTTQTLEEASNMLASLYQSKTIDWNYAHVYNRSSKRGNPETPSRFFSVHAIAHVVSSDIKYNHLRERLPKAYIKTSTYCSGPVTFNKKDQQQNITTLSEGYVNQQPQPMNQMEQSGIMFCENTCQY